jgi:oligogalacturonide lyase
MTRAALIVLFLGVTRAAAQEAPSEWIGPSGHRVIRLTDDQGGSSFYFHQNGYTAAGDKLIISTRQGPAALNLKTRQSELILEGRADNMIVAKKTRQLYYSKGRDIFATNIDTKATRKIGTLPEAWRRGSGFAVNADETLLAGSAVDGTKPSQAVKAGARGKIDLEARWAAKLPMVLYTVDVKSGGIKKVYESTDWLNHVQFSPSDPGLIMFCHEGPWHKVDRIWTIRTDGTGLRKVHERTMDMEIFGHEFFSADGSTIWYDLQTPRSKVFWLAGVNVATGEKTRYGLDRAAWSVHYNISPDGKHFAGDGGGPKSVAAPGNGQFIYLFTPENGKLRAEKLVDLSKHDYRLEPNVTFTPDGRWIVFRSNMHGRSHVYAVELQTS